MCVTFGDRAGPVTVFGVSLSPSAPLRTFISGASASDMYKTLIMLLDAWSGPVAGVVPVPHLALFLVTFVVFSHVRSRV